MQSYRDSRWDELYRQSYCPERASVLMNVRLAVARRELGFAARRLSSRNSPKPAQKNPQTRHANRAEPLPADLPSYKSRQAEARTEALPHLPSRQGGL